MDDINSPPEPEPHPEQGQVQGQELPAASAPSLSYASAVGQEEQADAVVTAGSTATFDIPASMSVPMPVPMTTPSEAESEQYRSGIDMMTHVRPYVDPAAYRRYAASMLPAAPRIPSATELVQSALVYTWEKVGYPLLKAATIGAALAVVAGISAYFLRRALIPAAVVDEAVYFDFSASPLPFASVNVLKLEHQWEYLHNSGNSGDYDSSSNGNGGRQRSSASVRGRTRAEQFFTAGADYNLDLRLVLPFSPRNVAMGKFMVHMTVFDSAGDAIARAARPVVVPTAAPVTALLTSLLTYPWRLLGVLPRSEVFSTTIPFMHKFREPHSAHYPATESVDMTLSSADADVEQAFLTVMPAMGPLRSLVYYYPLLSWLVLAAAVMWAELAGLGAFFLYRKAGQIASADDDDDDPHTGSGAGGGGRPAAAWTQAEQAGRRGRFQGHAQHGHLQERTVPMEAATAGRDDVSESGSSCSGSGLGSSSSSSSSRSGLGSHSNGGLAAAASASASAPSSLPLAATTGAAESRSSDSSSSSNSNSGSSSSSSSDCIEDSSSSSSSSVQSSEDAGDLGIRRRYLPRSVAHEHVHRHAHDQYQG